MNSSIPPSSQVRPIDGSIVEILLALEFGDGDISFGGFDRGKRGATNDIGRGTDLRLVRGSCVSVVPWSMPDLKSHRRQGTYSGLGWLNERAFVL